MPGTTPRPAASRYVRPLTFLLFLSAIVGLLPLAGHAGQSRPLSAGVFSAAQAQRGDTLYQAQCASCHGKALEGLVGPMLVGDGFNSKWAGHSVEELVSKIQKQMPFRKAGTITRAQALDLSAYILRADKFPAGQAELADASLSGLTFPGTPPVATVAGTSVQFRRQATLAELMRGVTFPNANIIFNTQSNDPAEPLPKRLPRKSGNQDYFEWGLGIYPGWQMVDHAALALIDTTELFLIPGRRCENGRPVPVDAPDFKKFTEDVIAMGQKLYVAAQTRDHETIAAMGEELSLTCQNCHRVYRANNNRCVAVVPAPDR